MVSVDVIFAMWPHTHTRLSDKASPAIRPKLDIEEQNLAIYAILWIYMCIAFAQSLDFDSVDARISF